MNNRESSLEQRLARLFQLYRESCVPPEPSPSFMVELWRRIDARRSFLVVLKRWTLAYVTAGVVACLVLGLLTYIGGRPGQVTPAGEPAVAAMELEAATAQTSEYARMVFTELEGYEVTYPELR